MANAASPAAPSLTPMPATLEKPVITADANALGAAEAACVAARLRALAARQETVAVIFATGASQLATLRALTAMPDLPWRQVIGFHLDEYLGLPATHAASFRRYLRVELVEKAPLQAFHFIPADAADPLEACRDYAALLAAHPPQLGLLGIGENGHLAFNDPGAADFEDAEAVKVVALDGACRAQQVAEGWFARLADVPAQAITLTLPTIFRIPELMVAVPGERKAEIVRRTLEEPISPSCPATLLRRHPNVRLFLDAASARRLPS